MGGDPSRVRVTGPLAVFAEGFAGELGRLGYKPNAAADGSSEPVDGCPAS
jgi:hypothetical protein